MNIIGTGLSGLVGSRIVELNPHYNFTDLSLDSGYNILRPETLEEIFKNNSAEVVLHLAAFTDTNAAWNQKGDKDGLCYQLNVSGTQNIVDLCQKYNKYLINISTDFVFDGTKSSPYTEEDTPNPLDWYGQTKYEAEQVVINSKIPASIVRIALPYRANFTTKLDAARKILSKLQNNEVVTMFTDQITTPTFVDDIAIGMGKIIDKKPTGIYHLVGSSSQSPFAMAKKIAEVFNCDQDLVKPSSLLEYLKNPEVRPYAVNDSLSNQKFVSEFGYIPRTLTEGLMEMKQQLDCLPSPRS